VPQHSAAGRGGGKPGRKPAGGRGAGGRGGGAPAAGGGGGGGAAGGAAGGAPQGFGAPQDVGYGAGQPTAQQLQQFMMMQQQVRPRG